MLWPLFVILIVLFADLLEGFDTKVVEFDFSSPPELVPSELESEESRKTN